MPSASVLEGSPLPICHVCGIDVVRHVRYRGPHTGERHAFIASCPGCGKLIRRKPAEWLSRRCHCSRHCYWRFNREKFSRPKVAVTCLVCGTVTLRWPSRAYIQTCSHKCASRLMGQTYRGQNHWSWRGGALATREYGPDWRRISRGFRRCHAKCEHCRKARSQVIHHIVPVRQFAGYAEAHQEHNLMALCRKCHGLEHCSGSQMRLVL